MYEKKSFRRKLFFVSYLFTFILILKLTFLIILVNKLVYSLGRIHQSADRLIMIEIIYNLGEELAHVSLNKVWLSFDIVTYISDNIKAKPYFIEADMSKFLAKIIDDLNHDKSIGGLMDPTERIHELIDKYNQECKLEYENECK